MKTIIKVYRYMVLIIFALINSSAFALEDTCPNETQPLISSGDYYICSFAALGEMGVYRISVSKGDLVTVAITVLEVSETKRTEPRIKIINPDGSIAVNKWGYYGLVTSVMMNSDGIATIIVSDDEKYTLQYSLEVNCTGYCGSNSLLSENSYKEGYQDGLQANARNIISTDFNKQDTCPSAQSIVSSGTYFICSFATRGDMDVYRISVSEGDRLTVAVSVLEVSVEKRTEPRIKIVNPDGSIASNDDGYNSVISSAVINSNGLATIILTDDEKYRLQYSVQINCIGTCSENSDGDNYLAGYQEGLQSNRSDVTVPSIDISLPTFSFNNNILHLPVVQVILDDSFSLYEAQLKLVPEKGCFVLDGTNTHSIESTSATCSAPKVNSMLIDEPGCEQLWRYRVFGIVALDDLQQKRHLIRAKLDDGLNELVMRNAAIGLAGNLADIVDLKNLTDASNEALEKVLLNMGIDLPKMVNELLLPGNVTNETTIEFSYLITAIINAK